MKFGKINHPERADLTLPEDHEDTRRLLAFNQGKQETGVQVGLAKWGRKDLKNFFPPGTKDELHYYGRQFGAVELNATFYGHTLIRCADWHARTPHGFVFFPKIPQSISHDKRLKDTEPLLEYFLRDVDGLKEKLGTIFLQMPDDFAPGIASNVQDLTQFVRGWPKEYPLAVELRHTDWFNNESVCSELCALLQESQVTNVITDTAGRRDILHMRLTTPRAFVRYVGANISSDYTRLDDWVARLDAWSQQGVSEIMFFVHQHNEGDSPQLARHLIEQLNESIRLDIRIPSIQEDPQASLFD